MINDIIVLIETAIPYAIFASGFITGTILTSLLKDFQHGRQDRQMKRQIETARKALG